MLAWGTYAQRRTEYGESHTRTSAQLKLKGGHPIGSLAKPASFHSIALVVERKVLPRVEETGEKRKKIWAELYPALVSCFCFGGYGVLHSPNLSNKVRLLRERRPKGGLKIWASS